ncbi:DUF7551 domain-containing protein [Halorientalis marina]|uniref:DUF7551 domain-containing protein n=1 Tax=Halorientalis marina TaxID=2931976 RepID=UPI001FF21167|nr:hypothetical protein [Halorientalis marina]
MVGTTLNKIRARIEALASPGGEFRVVCGRTGTSPVPVAGKRFPDREAAEEAAQTAAAYRDVLRRWDPRAPWYDFIACEVPDELDGGAPAPAGEIEAPERSRSALTGYCHDVAAAVFETLSVEGHEDVESGVMDAYCERADDFDDPDALCFHLLGTLARELDDRLSPGEGATVLEGAAAEFPRPSTSEDPLDATFGRLQRLGLVEGYRLDPRQGDRVGQQSWRVTVEGYALAVDGRPLPALPIAIDLCRRLPSATLRLSAAERLTDRTWRFDLTATTDDDAAGLLCVPLADAA